LKSKCDGTRFPSIDPYPPDHNPKEISMSQAKRYARKQAKARMRRRHNAQERLERDRRQAQQAADALHQALEELGLPDTLVSEIEGRLRSSNSRSALKILYDLCRQVSPRAI
jgi:hypothetical protein